MNDKEVYGGVVAATTVNATSSDDDATGDGASNNDSEENNGNSLEEALSGLKFCTANPEELPFGTLTPEMKRILSKYIDTGRMTPEMVQVWNEVMNFTED